MSIDSSPTLGVRGVEDLRCGVRGDVGLEALELLLREARADERLLRGRAALRELADLRRVRLAQVLRRRARWSMKQF